MYLRHPLMRQSLITFLFYLKEKSIIQYKLVNVQCINLVGHLLEETLGALSYFG